MNNRARAYRYTPLLIVTTTLLLALAGCGGGAGAGKPFSQEDAWKTSVPDSATIVSSAELQRMIASGEVELRSTADIEALQQARDAAFADDLELLATAEDVPPDVAALLGTVAPEDGFVGDTPVTAPNGATYVLEGPGTRIHGAVAAYELAHSAQNALTAYTVSYDLLPEGLKTQAASPASLAGATVEAVMAALAQLDQLLEGDESIRAARLEPVPAGPASAGRSDARVGGANATLQIEPGHGNDEDHSCPAPTGLASLFWYPLKSFVSPMKDQGARGTCWAFAALGAVESQHLVQQGADINLSEQFIVNQVKRDWWPSDYSEGFSGPEALASAADHGQPLAEEVMWTYNPAVNRPQVPDGTAAAFARTCDPYGNGPDGGLCSETAHESPQFCAYYGKDYYCGYARIAIPDGLTATRAYQVWHNSAVFDFNLNLYRQLLAAGHALIAVFPVYKGFMVDADADGYVSNFATTYVDGDGMEVPGAYGSHEALIVGFISNEELAAAHHPADVPGGGYFVLKNSWGCDVGDGGYYYVPARYVSSLFTALYALDFGPERSDAWHHEQQFPGSTQPPHIETPKLVNVDLRVEEDLGKLFEVTHPVAKTVDLVVTSDLDGVIYDGGWITDPYAFGSTLPYTFETQGERTLALTASYGGRSSHASFKVNVWNSTPGIQLEASGTAHQGEPYTITALVSDRNEPSPTTLCETLVWTVEAPDEVTSSSGCTSQVTFGAQGLRSVIATVHDTEGVEASAELGLEVGPPPENPYPRIQSAGVYERKFHGQLPIYTCGDVAVGSGEVIDFEAFGCTLSLDPNAPKPPRYTAAVTVENPDAEALTYDWRVYVSYAGEEHLLEEELGSPSNVFVPYSPGNSAPTTFDCRVWVRVNAPDESRSKAQTVWNGRCSYLATRIG